MAKTISILDSLKKYGVAKEEEEEEEKIIPKEIIENQVKDLFSEAVLDTLADAKPEATINSIHKGYFMTWGSSQGFTDEYRLSNFIQKLPHGIVDKKATGVGATTLELKSPRHSIIVAPTKKLAYSKFKWAENNLNPKKVLYVGTSIGEFRDRVSKDEIINHMEQNSTQPLKFLVVADSLDYLMNILGEEAYKHCFLMVDEIDLLQADSNYRPNLETVIDHYFKFDVKNRCIVTATMGEFSNPLFQNECRFEIEELSHKKRDIRLIHINQSNSINHAVTGLIKKYPEDKILIAYNTVSQVKNIISMLDESTQKECAIMCSESSRNDAGNYYYPLKDDSTLPKRINFMTCSYFSGIDINDTYNLITVSNVKYAHQMLTTKKITQIYGRCRVKDGILSDTIIYNTTEYEPKFKRTTAKYRNTLIKKANKVLDIIKAADIIQDKDKDLEDLFKVVKNAISDKALETPFRGQPIPLIRPTINEGKYDIAYLNIDFLVEREQLFNDLYVNQEKLYKALVSEGHQVIEIQYKDNMTDEEKSAEQGIDNHFTDDREELIDSLQATLVTDLKEKADKLPTGVLNKYVTEKLRTCSKEEKPLLDRFIKLNEFVESDKLLDYLYEIRHKNIKALKSLNNTIMFWCLAENHPLRISMREAFEKGKEYTPEEIHEKIEPIVKYHFHKTIKPRTSISLFKAYFEVSRPRNSYVVIKENPLNFEERKTSIGKKDNNLLKYFEIN
ncbi:hypothetical protein [Dysgonomonas gadei]|uniref:Uncharacterized protein n=1 Tax=Dysgonomonas gadei ATCC BAA-286 TaxID=742766 RepID=F5IVF6_9BACT|nr:hypothetical protein [Dysgonomonas gadei]EGK02606.1 hypothetical protein HMPREF9455_00856 [Dysgonomonas gadei ATCC BAA-286]